MSAVSFRAARPSAFALAIVLLALLVSLTLLPPSNALGAKASKPGRAAAAAASGRLVQLPGERGCLVDRSVKAGSCGVARALKGAGPFMGSRAIAVSADGSNVYVASSRSDAIAIFVRNRRTGALRQLPGRGGCVAAKGSGGCARAVGLDGPNSVALSPEGRFLYATSRGANSVTAFRRNSSTGALTQLAPGSGCVSGIPIPGCAAGRALVAPDVVAVSPDGANVYAGSFFGNAVATFQRARNGVLYQASDASGCIAEAIAGCAPAVALGAPEGLAISPDGASAYVASFKSGAIDVLDRDRESGFLAQKAGRAGCLAARRVPGCSPGRALRGVSSIAISPDGRSVYSTSFASNAVNVFRRKR